MYQEDFKPISVRYTDTPLGHLLFRGRLLVDLQAKTIYSFLLRHLPNLSGRVLDVGCGQSPYVHLFQEGIDYTGVDVENASQFGMLLESRVVPFDGATLPFANDFFDHVLCTEVLEHVEDPPALINEMWRVLKVGGTFLGSVPFSARVHHAPVDFQRFTVFKLRSLFSKFSNVEILERGCDVAAIASKLVVIAVRLGQLNLDWSLLWRLPSLFIMAPIVVSSLVAAHMSVAFRFGSKDDPLGYAIRAVKM